MIPELLTAAMRILAGISLIVLGRRLFWIFIGIVGFLAGFEMATLLLSDQSDWVALLLALVAGAVGILLARLLQGFAILVGGFLAGGYCSYQLSLAFIGEVGGLTLLFLLIGGVLGAFFARMLFDWALIFLSSLTGAIIIAQSIHFDPPVPVLLFAALSIVGVITQASLLIRRERTSPS